MRLLYPALLALPLLASAQALLPMPADSATYVLHKFAQPIGRETYRLTRTAQADTYDVRLRVVGRGATL